MELFFVFFLNNGKIVISPLTIYQNRQKKSVTYFKNTKSTQLHNAFDNRHFPLKISSLSLHIDFYHSKFLRSFI